MPRTLPPSSRKSHGATEPVDAEAAIRAIARTDGALEDEVIGVAH
jgi:hypothetical protein